MYQPEADHRTTLRGGAAGWFVDRVRQQRDVARGAGCSLADASAALAWHDHREADREHWHTVDTVREACGVYVDSTRDRAAHASAVTSPDDGQPWQALHALAVRDVLVGRERTSDDAPVWRVDGAGRVTDAPVWSHTYLDPADTVGRRRSPKRAAAAKQAGQVSAAKRQHGEEPLSAADRMALKRRRDRESRALANGEDWKAVQQARAKWLARRAKRGSDIDALASALAAASDSWDRDK